MFELIILYRVVVDDDVQCCGVRDPNSKKAKRNMSPLEIHNIIMLVNFLRRRSQFPLDPAESSRKDKEGTKNGANGEFVKGTRDRKQNNR